MNETLEFVRRAVLIGAGATLVMDVWAALLRQFGVPSLNLDCLGRWIGHLARGQWMHVSIAAAAPIRGERWMGWCAHYSIGITFSAQLLWTYGVEWALQTAVTSAQQMPITGVRGCCMNSHQYVAVTKRRPWNLLKVQHVGWSVRLPDDGFHALAPATFAFGRVRSQARAPAAPTS